MIPSVDPIRPFQPKPEKSSPKKNKVSGIAKEPIRQRSKDTSDIPSKKTYTVLQAKAKEAGDIVPDYHQDLVSKDGAVWKCVDRRPDLYGGFIYIFKLDEEYDMETFSKYKDGEKQKRIDNVQKKVLEMYPAVEPLSNVTDKENEKLESELGYMTVRKDKGLYYQAPDKEALKARWEVFRKKEGNEELPPFNVLETAGIAGDLEFIEGYIIYDAVLSSGKEFVHDHSAHIINLLKRALSSNYKVKNYEFKKNILSAYKKILIIKKIINEGNILEYFNSNRASHEKKISKEDISNALKLSEKFFGAIVDGDTARVSFDMPILTSNDLFQVILDNYVQLVYETKNFDLDFEKIKYIIEKFKSLTEGK